MFFLQPLNMCLLTGLNNHQEQIIVELISHMIALKYLLF